MAKQKKPVYLSINGPISGNYVAHSAKFKIFNLPAGEYEVRFEKDGCYTTTTAIVPPDKGMPYLEVNALKNDCNINTGIVDFNIDATGAEYTLSWSGPTSGSTTLTESTSLEDFQTGSYQFELEDANGCKSIAMATINREELEVALTAKESRCAFNGKIDVAIAGGLAPYSIRWEGAGSGSRKVNSQETRLSLPKGTYIVYVTDANGCEAYASTTIVEETTDLYCSITPYATTCLLDNGKIDIFISGGRKPYVLAYEGPVSGSKTVNGSTVFDDLPAGTYTTYLEDANGCSVSESSTIEVGEVKNATAAFTYVATGTSVNFYNNSTYGTYEWSFGDGESTTSTHPNHAYTKEGSYEVCLTATGECDANTICQTIIITAFVPITQEEKVKTNTPQSSGEMSNEGMRVLQNFPNPFSSTTDILFELPEAQTTTIMVHDQFGRTINSQTSYYEKGLNRFTFQQDKLAPGIYYYTIKAGNTTQTKRMLVN
jgi:PKD repeat protein